MEMHGINATQTDVDRIVATADYANGATQTDNASLWGNGYRAALKAHDIPYDTTLDGQNLALNPYVAIDRNNATINAANRVAGAVAAAGAAQAGATMAAGNQISNSNRYN